MISPISTTSIVFKSYRQKFTDEEFRQKLDESVAWAKDNVNNLAYLRPKFLMDRKLEKDARLGISALEKYRQEFKKSDFLSHVELFLKNKEIIGKVSYLNSKPIEIKTQMPCNFKNFFKTIKESALAQAEQDKLMQDLWNKNEEISYNEALQRKRYKELAPDADKEPNPIVVIFDSIYNKLSDKIVILYKEQEEIYSKLNALKSKLCNRQFSIKTKFKL